MRTRCHGSSASGDGLDLNSERIEDADLKCLAQISSLTDLSLMGASVTDSGIADIAGLTSLETIDLSDTRITDDAIRRLSSLTNLRLVMANNTAITGSALPHLGRLPRLEWLQVRSTNIRSLELKGGFARLRTIDLFNCPVDDACVTSLPCLREISLRSEGLSSVRLEELSELQELSINRCDDGNLEPRRRVGLQLRNLPNLVSLRIDARIDASDLSSLGTMRLLTTLCVHGVDASGDFLAAAADLPNLKVIQLGHMHNVTNEHLASLARSQDLRAIYLGWGGGYGGEALQYFAGLEELEVLSFNSATPLTDEQAGSLSHLHNLQSLNLTSSCRLNGDALRHLAGLKNLRYLGIRGPYGNRRIRGIRDNDLGHLAGLTCLEELDLMGNELTGPGLRHLVSLPRLRMLNLSINPLTNEALPHLTKMGSLRTLMLERVALTCDCLDSLQQFSFLEVLWLPRGLLSTQQLTYLREALPDTRVYETSFTAPAPKPPE